MAIYLFKLIRKKLREREAQKAIPTTDDSHLVPQCIPGQKLQTPEDHHSRAHTGSSAAGSHVDLLTPEEAAQRKVEAHRRRIRQWKLMLGLALPNLLASVDVTIVAPAIPLISSHFRKPLFSFFLDSSLC
jgi:hypothetical protein